MAKRMHAGLAFPKTVKRRKKGADDVALDKLENKEVVKRSESRCEVTLHELTFPATKSQPAMMVMMRCTRRATQVHHMIGGRGKRGKGISAFREHKQHVCYRCHQDITGDVGGKRLLREGGSVPLWTDHYRRVK